MSQHRVGRRTALKVIGGAFASLGPVQMLAQTIVSGLCAKAASAATLTRPRNYLMVNLYGAPARWVFDNPLRVNRGETLSPAGMVATRFSKVSDNGGESVELDYSTHDVNGNCMPSLWQFEVPRAGGGTRPMADLMTNMLTLRGFDMGLDGHSINNSRIVAPIPGGASLSGLVADAAQAGIPALNVGLSPGASSYYAPRGTGLVEIPGDLTHYVDFLLAPFALGDDVALFTDRAHVDETVERALEDLREVSSRNNPAAAALYRDRDNAEILLRGSISGFHDAYLDLVAKYDGLINASIRNTNLVGLTDKAIRGLTFPFVAPGDVTSSQGIGKFACEAIALCNDDLRTLFNTATIGHLAKQMALSEYVLVNGLSSSITITPGSLTNLHVEGAVNQTDIVKTLNAAGDSVFSLAAGAPRYTGSDPYFQLVRDPHFSGTYLTMMGTSLYFRAISSCLLELIDRLRATTLNGVNVFDETVVHLAAEFDRSPRVDGSGSDHGWRGNTASLFSGAINAPMLLGNIYHDAPDPLRRVGTWGEGAPVRALKKKAMNLGNVMSSLAMLLRVPSPTPNDRPVIVVDANSTIATIERGQQIEPT